MTRIEEKLKSLLKETIETLTKSSFRLVKHNEHKQKNTDGYYLDEYSLFDCNGENDISLYCFPSDKAFFQKYDTFFDAIKFDDIYWGYDLESNFLYALRNIIKNKNAVKELPDNLVKEIKEALAEPEE